MSVNLIEADVFILVSMISINLKQKCHFLFIWIRKITIFRKPSLSHRTNNCVSKEMIHCYQL